MTAWRVRTPGPMSTRPLERVTIPVPSPAPGELLVGVRACGVCRTDLHVTEGDLPGAPARRRARARSRRRSRGAGRRIPAANSRVGDRVGVAWLRHTCGTCQFCVRGEENLCPQSRYTGWDADGGYAEFATVPAAFAHPLPAGLLRRRTGPAAVRGHHRLPRRCCAPTCPPAGGSGIYGFGGSAHITAQVALAQGAEVHVMTRGEQPRASWRWRSARRRCRAPTTRRRCRSTLPSCSRPVGELVLPALEALDRGGTLAIAGIHLTDIPALDYERHLFHERQLRSVTSNTRADAREFLAFAQHHRIEVTTPEYPLDRADQALSDLSAGRISGAAVLRV